jgi:hypothetical protein
LGFIVQSQFAAVFGRQHAIGEFPIACNIQSQDRNPPFWKAELTRVAKRVSSMLVRSGEVAMETGQHVAMYTAEAGATVRASLQRHLANQAKAKEE